MNKRILTVLLVIVVMIVAAIVMMALLTAPGSTNAVDDAATAGSDSSPSEDTEASPTPNDSGQSIDNDGGGTYSDYSPDAVAASDGRILLFFHAPWCPQCVSLDADIESSGVPSGMTVLKVDYDSQQDLRAQYGVTQQTTIVEVDSSGSKLKENYVAYAEPQLSAVLEALR